MNDPGLELWALDEVHFQQHGSRCRMWVPPELKDPVLFHHPTRKSVGYFGAVRLADGRFVHLRENERFNATTFATFMKELSSRRGRGRRIVVIVDDARYHTGRSTETGAKRTPTPSRWSSSRLTAPISIRSSGYGS